MTRLLPADAVDRARAWVSAHGRPLDEVRLAHVLGDASPVELTEALQPFRNDDGGFGHALEPDLRAPESSALATLTALDIMRSHDVPFTHPVAASACEWLLRAATEDDEGRVVWRFIPESAQFSAHAPWWDQAEPGQLEATFAGFVANPGLALSAHLWRRAAATPASVPPALLERLASQALGVVRAGLSRDEVNAHDAASHLAAEPSAPETVRKALVAYLRDVLPERVMSTPDAFSQYGIHPLWVAATPRAPVADVIRPQVELALDHTIASQEPDGSWTPFWNWGGGHPDVWRQAELEWRGTLIVRNLAALLAYGRVERRP